MLAITVDPADSSIVYLGTEGDGLYRSIDAGDHWARIDTAPVSPVIAAIAVSATNHSIIYLATSRDIFVSQTSGASWQPVPVQASPHSTTDVLFDPGNPGRLWAAAELGVFTSISGGQIWDPRNNGLRARYVPWVIVARENPSLIFAAGAAAGVLRSEQRRNELGQPRLRPSERTHQLDPARLHRAVSSPGARQSRRPGR